MIAVNPCHGRSGQGRRLMDACEKITAERQFSQLALTVDPENHQAIGFYKALGWTRLEENDRCNDILFKALSHENSASGLSRK